MAGFERYPCAYHQEQPITHFCRCSNCLLPVCNICLRLHTEQHTVNQTRPHFTQLSSLVKEIKESYSDLQLQIERIRSSLLKLERDRKSNEALLRQTLVHHRNNLFEALEEALEHLERTIVLEIVQEDRSFISELLKIEAKLEQAVKYLQQQSQNLKNRNALKQIIEFQIKGTDQIKQDIDKIRSQATALEMRSFIVTVDESYLRKAVSAVTNYMTLSAKAAKNFK